MEQTGAQQFLLNQQTGARKRKRHNHLPNLIINKTKRYNKYNAMAPIIANAIIVIPSIPPFNLVDNSKVEPG